MTAQIAETLHFQGDNYALCTCPLDDYFALGGSNPGFQVTSTALWRGYVGRWEILSGRLYLVGLDGTFADGTPATLAALFSGFTERVFAHWYSGTMRLPQGRRLRYVHGGFGSVYERDLLLDVEQGTVVATRLRHNGASSPAGAPKSGHIEALALRPPTPPRIGG